MLGRIFPKRIDNAYRGSVLAIWILVPVVILKFLMGANVAGLNPWIDNREILRTADAIPIDSYGAEAASAVVFLFSAWGLALLALSVMGVVVLIRYRAMIPLMYFLLAFEQLGRKALSEIHPVVRSVEAGGGHAGFWINWGLSAALVIGFILSLAARRDASRIGVSA
jgi:hypothetical protein